ncbi:hypothetical protein CPAR01_04740, partial [Colletotrichum paranaense]
AARFTSGTCCATRASFRSHPLQSTGQSPSQKQKGKIVALSLATEYPQGAGGSCFPAFHQSHIDRFSGSCLYLLPQAVTRPTGFSSYLACWLSESNIVCISGSMIFNLLPPCRTSTVAGASHPACLPPSRFPAMLT